MHVSNSTRFPTFSPAISRFSPTASITNSTGLEQDVVAVIAPFAVQAAEHMLSWLIGKLVDAFTRPILPMATAFPVGAVESKTPCKPLESAMFSARLDIGPDSFIRLETPTQCMDPRAYALPISIDCVVSESLKNKDLMNLLSLASHHPIATERDLTEAIYRLFEAKGRVFGDAWHAATSDRLEIVSTKTKMAHDSSVIRGRKTLRNIRLGATYDRPMVDTVRDFFSARTLFQQMLLNDLRNGLGVNTVVYRFGALNGNFLGDNVSKLMHTASSAEGHLLWNPSYFNRAMDGKTLRIYEINTNGGAVNISKITDERALNPNSKIGTKEVVFPEGSRFSKSSSLTYSIPDTARVEDVDVQSSDIANYILKMRLEPDDGGAPKFIKLLLKWHDQGWKVGTIIKREMFDDNPSAINKIQVVHLECEAVYLSVFAHQCSLIELRNSRKV